MIIDAVVVWADDPDGPDLLTPIGDEPMIVHPVRCLLDARLAERVAVVVPQSRLSSVERACRGLPVQVRPGLGGVPVRTHIDQRAGRALGDGGFASKPDRIVLLHDAARPLAPPELAVAVVDAVRAGHPAAAPMLPMTDTVKQIDAAGLVVASPDRELLRVVQTPMAVQARLLTDPPRPAVTRLVEAGVAVHAVPGHPLAFAVRTAWDLELAQLLAEPARRG